MKNGDRVRSIYPEDSNYLKLGTIIAYKYRKATKHAEAGYLVKVKWDKSTNNRSIYHECFLEVLTPLEEALL